MTRRGGASRGSGAAPPMRTSGMTPSRLSRQSRSARASTISKAAWPPVYARRRGRSCRPIVRKPRGTRRVCRAIGWAEAGGAGRGSPCREQRQRRAAEQCARVGACHRPGSIRREAAGTRLESPPSLASHPPLRPRAKRPAWWREPNQRPVAPPFQHRFSSYAQPTACRRAASSGSSWRRGLKRMTGPGSAPHPRT